MPRGSKKGLALQQGFHVPLAARRHRFRKRDDGCKSQRIIEGAIGLAEQHRVIPAGSVAKQRLQPPPQAFGIADMTIVNRLLQSVRIGEGADRKGRRQPGHEAKQRLRVDPFSHGDGDGRDRGRRLHGKRHAADGKARRFPQPWLPAPQASSE
ncbi:hypothetical protein D9M72_584800 [compost metagenome]